MNASYYNQVIPLIAGVRKVIPVSNGSSFVLNTGTGFITCRVNSKSFRLREAQINNHVEEVFNSIELESDIDQDVDVRFGTNGMLVSPPQKEFVSITGELVTSMDAGDIETLSQAINDKTNSKTNVEYADVTISTLATSTVIGADPTAKETIIQRIDENEGNCRIGADPTASKGLVMFKDDARVFSGGGIVKIYNPTASDITVSICRELF